MLFSFQTCGKLRKIAYSDDTMDYNGVYIIESIRWLYVEKDHKSRAFGIALGD